MPKLQELNMDACALTDHGVMFGSYKFAQLLKAEGIKPILGCEIYVAPRSHHKKEAGIDNNYYHMILLAKNKNGYQNLMKIVSRGHLEGFYYKPRVDLKTIEKYSEDLICTTACLGGPVAKEFNKGDEAKAYENAKRLKEIFGDNLYIEIQRNGIQEQEVVNPKLIKLAKELELPIVATCDVHYLEAKDYEIQEVMWCIADGKTLDDPTRRQTYSHELYLKSHEEMEELFADIPEAIENTRKISDMIEDYDLKFDRVEPEYLNLPKDMDSGEYLRKLVFEGAEKKYGEVDEALRKRLEFELEVIGDKGYNDYFLVTKEFIDFCHDNDIVVGIRGSACGSAVSYCVGITHVEPIEWELYFERFLNPERMSPPDIDIDIADARRDEVIQFTIDRYGANSVKQIGTFSKLQTRQAIRDVSRVLGIDLGIADQLSKMVEIVFGKAKDIDYMIENNHEFADLIVGNPEMERMADIVRKIAGMCRGVSTHACGIVITPGDVDQYVPLQRDSKTGEIGMTQYEMSDLEDVGLMKFDFLGLRNLAVIGEALQKIKEFRDEEIDLHSLDPHDEATYELIKSGHTVGIFQMESEGMRKTVRGLKPNTQEEICYLLAAYRPGPMQFIDEYIAVKEGRKEAEYIVPQLEEILSVTNGVITYQEQVIRIAVDIAGYTMGAADKLRKAMGKKKMDIMELEKPKFIKGAVERGYNEADIEELWERLLQFANYGFNKAHAASYAMVSFWTAYLKSHYPLEFMAALLEGDLDDFNRVVIDLNECARMNIKVYPPNINKSTHKFTVEDGRDIRFGMAAIKNVGEDAVRHLVEEREEHGEFKNYDDFLYRAVKREVQKRVIEYLIMAGALDDFGDRSQLLDELETRYQLYKEEVKVAERGQFDLFAGGEGDVKIHIVDPQPLRSSKKTHVQQKLEWENELLGVYLTSHPLDDLTEFFEEKGAVPISILNDMKAGRKIHVVGGIASNVKRITTKKGDSMAFLTVEDKTGSTEMIAFPRTYEELKDELRPNVPMLFAGRINQRDGEESRSFILEKAKVVDATRFGSNFDGVTFKITSIHTSEEILELREFIKAHQGDHEVKILMQDDSGQKAIKLEHKIKLDDETKEWLRRFG